MKQSVKGDRGIHGIGKRPFRVGQLQSSRVDRHPHEKHTRSCRGPHRTLTDPDSKEPTRIALPVNLLANW